MRPFASIFRLIAAGTAALILVLAVVLAANRSQAEGLAVTGRTLAPQAGPASGNVAEAAMGTAFTYQGYLSDNGAPASGKYDLRFTLYTSEANGASVGRPVTVAGVTVNNGLFTVQLDFGAVFEGQALWLGIEVRESGQGAYQTLAPRQPLTPVPYALYAAAAADAGTAVTATLATTATTAFTATGAASVEWMNVDNRPPGLDDGDSDTTYSAGAGLDLDGTQFSFVAPPRPLYQDNLVASSGTIGGNTSLIIGADGLPLISFYDAGSGALKVAHCLDTACRGSEVSTLDNVGIVGEFNAITIGRDGYGLISYYDRTQGALKLAVCQDFACKSASTHTIDSGGNVGQYTSITTTEEGFAFISYYDVSNGNLKAIRCESLTCASSDIWDVDDSVDDVGQYSSATRNLRGWVYISYYDASHGDLKIAACTAGNLGCGSKWINVVDETDDTGKYSSITTGVDDRALIAYAKGQGASTPSMKIAHCQRLFGSNYCNAGNVDIDTVISGSGVGFEHASITLAPDGLAVFAYSFSNHGRIYVTRCGEVICGEQVINDSTVSTGGPYAPSLAIGMNGLPVISYISDAGDDLRFVHCSDPICAPYRWTR